MREDSLLLRDIATSMNEKRNGTLDVREFEERYCKYSIMDDVASIADIEKGLEVRMVSERFKGIESPLTITGENTWEKIDSVLPQGLDDKIKSSLIVALGHIVLNDLKHEFVNVILPEGLDIVSSGMLKLSRIEKLVGQRIEWLLEIWNIQINNVRRTILQEMDGLLKTGVTVRDFIDAIDKGYQQLYEIMPHNAMLIELQGIRSVVVESQDTDSLDEATTRQLRRMIAKEKSQLSMTEVWPQVSLRDDTLVKLQHRPLINAYRKSINVLANPVLYKVFKFLSKITRPGQPTINRIIEILNYPRPSAVRFIDNMLPLVVERFVPALSKLGLRYRYLIAPKRGRPLPKNAIVSSMALKEGLRGVAVHVEPKEVDGPEHLVEGTRQLLVDIETISMRIDLFDETNNRWLTPWTEKRLPRPVAMALTQTERSMLDEPLPPRAIELLSILWGSCNSKKSRGHLLKYFGLQRVMASFANNLLNNGTLKFLYHPALEFTGLSSELFIAASEMKGTDLKKTRDWLTRLVPFSRVLISDVSRRERGDLVAEIRIPQFTEAIIKGVITDRLDKIAGDYIVDSVAQRTTFYLTGLIRAFDFKNGIWRDPW